MGTGCSSMSNISYLYLKIGVVDTKSFSGTRVIPSRHKFEYKTTSKQGNITIYKDVILLDLLPWYDIFKDRKQIEMMATDGYNIIMYENMKPIILIITMDVNIASQCKYIKD